MQFLEQLSDHTKKHSLLWAGTLISLSVPALIMWYYRNKKQKKDTGLKIEEILVYPVKSFKGMSVNVWPIGPRGLLFDRQWMVIQKKPVMSEKDNSTFKTDAEYMLISQRQLPRMSLIGSTVDLENGTLKMYTHDHDPLSKGVTEDDNENVYVMKSEFYSNESQFDTVSVELWGKEYSLLDMGDHVSEWLCRVLNKEGLRLCMMPQNLDRTPDDYHYDYLESEYGEPPVVQNNLSDDFPFHLATINTLDALNEQLTEKVDMIRFRPNFVVGRNSDLKPYSEETWKRIEIVQPGYEDSKEMNPAKIVHMYNVQVKTRCTMPNVNPETGKRSDYGPFQKLREIHMNPVYHQPIFGINTVNTEADVGKSIKTGSTIRVLDYHAKPIARLPPSHQQ